MKNSLDGPRVGSRAYLALQKLHSLGGGATAVAWLKAMGWDMSMHCFHHEVSRLTVRHQVFLRDQAFFITDAGKTHLGESLDAPPCVPGAVVAPPYVPSPRPLAAGNKVRLQSMREGAFDYLSIPSLHGSQRIAHKTALVVDTRVVKG